jgi:hypothetical protein
MTAAPLCQEIRHLTSNPKLPVHVEVPTTSAENDLLPGGPRA